MLPRNFIPGLYLKLRQLSFLQFTLSMFYISRFCMLFYTSIAITVDKSDQYINYLLSMSLEVIDVLNFSIFMWVLRTQKWPEFYNLNINEILIRQGLINSHNKNRSMPIYSS